MDHGRRQESLALTRRRLFEVMNHSAGDISTPVVKEFRSDR